MNLEEVRMVGHQAALDLALPASYSRFVGAETIIVILKSGRQPQDIRRRHPRKAYHDFIVYLISR